MSALPALETKLDELFTEWTPELSGNARRALARYLPWISLLLGLLTFYSAYLVWHWAHVSNQFIIYPGPLGSTAGGSRPVGSRFTFGIWLAIVVLIAEAGLYIAAFRALDDRRRRGWDLFFYALLLNSVFGFIIMLTAYGDFGNFLARLVGSAVGLYLLFQISEFYRTGPTRPPAAKPQPAKKRTAKARPKRKKA
ncbi:MAG TPA: hypothetical protein VHC21_02235 [Candidatus Saccharimonadales bacterium]|nr:hypothetical protein [Candidatus Saccharimonadales bacterium]